MMFFVFLAIAAAFLAYNVITYLRTDGTFWHRASVAWGNSVTNLGLVWTGFLALLTGAGQVVTDVTGDPNFAAVVAWIKANVSPQVGSYVTLATILLPILAAALGRRYGAQLRGEP